MLDSENRQRIMLQQEGLVLGNAGNCGAKMACEIARVQIDGIANALIRMEGVEDTAQFVFALSDRVCGGLREGTVYLPRAQPVGVVMDDKITMDVLAEPTHDAPTKITRAGDFYYGFLCGLGVMMLVTIVAMGRA